METSVTQVRHSLVSASRSAINADFLRRVRKTSLIFGAVTGVLVAFYFGLMPALAWAAGIVWSLANLAAIRSLMQNIITTETRDVASILVAMALKLPVLYAAAVVLLLVLKVPALWWLAGFSWPFFVAVMKSAGRIYLHLDETA
jgi:hypothetical protein